MRGVRPTPSTELLHLQSAGSFPLILRRTIVATLTLITC